MSDEGTEARPDGLSILEAAGQMEGLIDDTGLTLEQDQDPEVEDDQEVQDEEPAEVEDDASEDESDVEDVELEDDESEDVDPDVSDEDDEASPEDSELDLSRTVTRPVDGEDVEFTLEEAVGSYMQQRAITRRFQELAEQRKAVEAQVEAKRGERQKYTQGLETLEQVLEALQPEELSVEQIKEASPEELKAFKEHKERLEQVKAERERVQKEALAEYKEAREQRVAEESERLIEALGLAGSDEETQVGRLEKLAAYAQESYGYTPEELAAVTDHRPLVMLDKARRFDEMSDKGKEVRKKAKKAPVLKPGSTSGKKSSEKKRKKAARSRLSKTGDLRDAAKVFEDFIE